VDDDDNADDDMMMMMMMMMMEGFLGDSCCECLASKAGAVSYKKFEL
jgi:hypothetical protein